MLPDKSKESDEYELFVPGEGRKFKDGIEWLAGGALLGLGGLAYMARNFKNRGDTKVSVYLIHSRLLAQSTVIAALSCGMVSQMLSRMRKNNSESIGHE